VYNTLQLVVGLQPVVQRVVKCIALYTDI